MWAVDSLSVRYESHGDVLIARVAGFLTVASSDEMRRRIVLELEHAQARALVLDLCLATHLMREEDWRQVAHSASHSFPVHVPVASIVQQLMLPQADAHASAMRRRGFLRDVFTEEGRAIRWAKRVARAWNPA